MLTVSRAEVNDAEAILVLQKLAFQTMAGRINVPSFPPLSESLAALLLEFSTSIILKAIWDRQLVGSVRGRVENNVCDIHRLAVHPDFHGKGVGSKLLSHIETSAAGVSKYELFTSTLNMESLRLYGRRGYVITRVQDVSPAGPIVFMEKVVNGAQAL